MLLNMSDSIQEVDQLPSIINDSEFPKPESLTITMSPSQYAAYDLMQSAAKVFESKRVFRMFRPEHRALIDTMVDKGYFIGHKFNATTVPGALQFNIYECVETLFIHQSINYTWDPLEDMSTVLPGDLIVMADSDDTYYALTNIENGIIRVTEEITLDPRFQQSDTSDEA